MAGNFLGFSLPFGASNQSNPTAQPNNPNFPANKQLEPKNPDGSPRQQMQQQEGNNEPNNDPNNNPDPNKGAQGSQLDAFSDLFKLPTDDKGNVVSHSNPMAEPLLKVDPAALKAAASKMNFAAGIDPEVLTKAMSGQDPQAFMAVLNTVAQNGFAAAMQANAGVVETAFSKHTSRFESVLPDRIRETQINQAAPKHPALSHPAAAPMVAAMKSQIAAKNPHLPPDRVADMAENYFLSFAGDISKHNETQSTANKKPAAGEVDWNAVLGS
jgi:hypothetical protein